MPIKKPDENPIIVLKFELNIVIILLVESEKTPPDPSEVLTLLIIK